MKRHVRHRIGWLNIVGISIGLGLFLFGVVQGAPPHPRLLEQLKSDTVEAPYFFSHLDQMHAKGICTGEIRSLSKEAQTSPDRTNSPLLSGEFKALAILVQFTDHPSSVGATFFDSLLFDTIGSTVADYYHEISYGQLDIVTVNLPSTLGWQTAPQTYAYYVNGQNGTGTYPQNTQKLVEDLVDLVDAHVDFSNYDNNGDGIVDVLIVVHSGTGAELSGSNDDIWSHKWSITPRLKDGVYIRDYTIQPEFWQTPGDMTIGVYAHELGHGFGLPDLYDTDYSSNGIGRWGLMSFGCWLGPQGFGRSPAHPCAWSRVQMGLATPQNVTATTLSQAIVQVEETADIYRLWNGGVIGNEYFLVENRQKVGYDSYLPGDGLLIWHIDESKAGNTEEWWSGQPSGVHYKVALEQADGLFELEHKTDYGDTGDPFPGSTNNTTFSALSTPSSHAYNDSATSVIVDDISVSGAVMYADFTVGLSSGTGGDSTGVLLPVTIELSQNYPNPFNPSTTIFYSVSDKTTAALEIYNVMGQKVKTLFAGTLEAGSGRVVWDGCDSNGQEVSSGVYFYRFTAGGTCVTKKMMLVR